MPKFKIGDKVIVTKESGEIPGYRDNWSDKFPVGSVHEVKPNGFGNDLYVINNGLGYTLIFSDGSSSKWADCFELVGNQPKATIKSPDLCSCPMNVLMNRGCICGKK